MKYHFRQFSLSPFQEEYICMRSITLYWSSFFLNRRCHRMTYLVCIWLACVLVCVLFICNDYFFNVGNNNTWISLSFTYVVDNWFIFAILPYILYIFLLISTISLYNDRIISKWSFSCDKLPMREGCVYCKDSSSILWFTKHMETMDFMELRDEHNQPYLTVIIFLFAFVDYV